MHYFLEVLMFDGSFVAVFAVVAVTIRLSLKSKLLFFVVVDVVVFSLTSATLL